jgi:hypothetical protein
MDTGFFREPETDDSPKYRHSSVFPFMFRLDWADTASIFSLFPRARLTASMTSAMASAMLSSSSFTLWAERVNTGASKCTQEQAFIAPRQQNAHLDQTTNVLTFHLTGFPEGNKVCL